MIHSPIDRRVPCTYCLVGAGERCQDGQGDRVEWCHAVRMTAAAGLDPARMAARIDHLEERLARIEATQAPSSSRASASSPSELDDWLIRGVKGELYPCKPDIFEMTYERADQTGGAGR